MQNSFLFIQTPFSCRRSAIKPATVQYFAYYINKNQFVFVNNYVTIVHIGWALEQISHWSCLPLGYWATDPEQVVFQFISNTTAATLEKAGSYGLFKEPWDFRFASHIMLRLEASSLAVLCRWSFPSRPGASRDPASVSRREGVEACFGLVFKCKKSWAWRRIYTWAKPCIAVHSCIILVFKGVFYAYRCTLHLKHNKNGYALIKRERRGQGVGSCSWQTLARGPQLFLHNTYHIC